MWVYDYGIIDDDDADGCGFFIAALGIVSTDENPDSYSLSYVAPGKFGARASFIIGLKGDNGEEIEGWLLVDFPDDVAEIIRAEGVKIKDWKSGAEINLFVTEKGEVDA
jgi:hypothetical protein